MRFFIKGSLYFTIKINRNEKTYLVSLGKSTFFAMFMFCFRIYIYKRKSRCRLRYIREPLNLALTDYLPVLITLVKSKK